MNRRATAAVTIAVIAVIAGCTGGAKKGHQPSRQTGSGAMKISGIYGVPVPGSAELDKAASPQGTETYRVKDVNLTAFYDQKMPVGRRFNGLDFCGQRLVRRESPPPAPPTPERVWRKRGTKDLLVLDISDRERMVTIVDDRNDPRPPCR